MAPFCITRPSDKARRIRSRSASLSNENRGHSAEKEQHAPHARHSEAVSSAVVSAKWSFNPEVDRRGLFPPIALDLILDSLSVV